MLKKKSRANFQRIVEVFTQKIFNTLSNMKRHRIPDPDPQHWVLVHISVVDLHHIDADPEFDFYLIRIRTDFSL
jgi:hypothetical protein